jgi:hypothetical protein
VKANVLRTAVLAVAYAALHGTNALEVAVINAVRRDYLGLAPLGRDVAADEGIGQAIQLLSNVGR